MLVRDFAEIRDSVAAIAIPDDAACVCPLSTSVGIAESGGRITTIACTASSIRNCLDYTVTNSIESEIDIRITQIKGVNVDLRRIRLIEHVKEPGSELEL